MTPLDYVHMDRCLAAAKPIAEAAAADICRGLAPTLGNMVIARRELTVALRGAVEVIEAAEWPVWSESDRHKLNAARAALTRYGKFAADPGAPGVR